MTTPKPYAARTSHIAYVMAANVLKMLGLDTFDITNVLYSITLDGMKHEHTFPGDVLERGCS